MMRKRTTITSILLVCLLVLSSATVLFGNFASAYSGTRAANFLPNHFVKGLDTDNETQLSEQTADYIKAVLSSKYPTYDYRNSVCTASNFYAITDSLQSYDQAVIFSKGHLDMKTCYDGYAHYGISMYNSTTYNSDIHSVWDNEVFWRTSSKNVHTFMWHCRTAFLPHTSNGDLCGYGGLPRAFTHNLNIPLWGNSGSQVYLGWNDKTDLMAYNFTSGQSYQVYNINGGLTVGSPQYEWGINPNYKYAQVAGLYYYHLGQGYSTADALNKMANTIYGTDMLQTPLNDWLVVYGNANVGLPPMSPYYAVSATSSQTGSGYVNYPNNILGAPDGSYAYLNSGGYGNKAEITARFPTASISGQLYVKCYTPSGNGANLKVYVGDVYGSWWQVVNTNFYPPNLAINVNCGYVANIDKVSIVAFHEYNGYPSNIYVDAVWVQ